jgi:hypothetical protein
LIVLENTYLCKEFDLFEDLHKYTTTPIAIYLSLPLSFPLFPPTPPTHNTEQKPQNTNTNTKAIRKPQSNPRNEASQTNQNTKEIARKKK